VLNKLGSFPRVVPKKYIEEKGLDHFRANPVGTGPFKFVKWVPKGELVMAANEAWWGGAPKVKRLVFRSVPETASRVSELQAGGAHIVTGVPAFMTPGLAKSKDLEIQSPTSLRVVFFPINALTEGPLKDKRVRQALNYAIDKKAIIEGILKGKAIQTSTIVSPLVFGYDETINPYPYDPAKAKALLKEAGYEKGLKLTVNSPSGRYPNDKEVAGAVNEMLKKVGIETNLQIQESGTYVAKFIKHELDGIFLIGMMYPYYDVDSSYAFLDPANPWCHYHNQEIHSLVRQAQATMDADKRKLMASQVQKRMYEEATHIFLYNQIDHYGVLKKVKAFKARQDDYMDLSDVHLEE
jgi:peptide/nickel transport system substrate-binding protein